MAADSVAVKTPAITPTTTISTVPSPNPADQKFLSKVLTLNLSPTG